MWWTEQLPTALAGEVEILWNRRATLRQSLGEAAATVLVSHIVW